MVGILASGMTMAGVQRIEQYERVRENIHSGFLPQCHEPVPQGADGFCSRRSG